MIKYNWYYECDECGAKTQKESTYDYEEDWDVLVPSPTPNYKWNRLNGRLYCPKHNVLIETDGDG